MQDVYTAHYSSRERSDRRTHRLIKPLDTLINSASFLNRTFHVVSEYEDSFSSSLSAVDS